jgi:hypothetical protein
LDVVPALSALQQKAVWDGWLSSEIRANYFADLCHRYQRTQRAVTWLTLVASSGALLAFLTESLPPEWSWIRAGLAAAAAALSLWSVTAQNQKRATDCSDLHARWASLSNSYAALWDAMYSPDALRTLNELKAREVEISKSSNTFPNRRKLMIRWQDHVQRHHAVPV